MKAEDLAPLAEQAAREVGLDPWLILGQAHKESSFRPTVATGGGQHVGLLQVSRNLVARMFPGKNPFDPLTNLRAGAKYLADQVSAFGDMDLALAAYNWGPAKVSALLKKMQAETYEDIKSRVPMAVRFYVWRVGTLADNYRSLWGM